jgi:hypothetical protein
MAAMPEQLSGLDSKIFKTPDLFVQIALTLALSQRGEGQF